MNDEADRGLRAELEAALNGYDPTRVPRAAFVEGQPEADREYDACVRRFYELHGSRTVQLALNAAPEACELRAEGAAVRFVASSYADALMRAAGALTAICIGEAFAAIAR